jgi:hypothetical protein
MGASVRGPPAYAGDYERAIEQADQRGDPFTGNPLICEAGTVADLLVAEFVEETPLVEGFLWPGGCSNVVGEGGVGKTFLAGSLAKSLAAGEPFIGLETSGPRAGERCRVGAFVLERNGRRHQQRMQAQGDVADLWTDVQIRCPGFPPGVPSFWDICDTTQRGQLIQWIEHDRLDVVILDPLNHVKSPELHEHDPSDMTVVIQALSAIRDTTGAALVLLHHPPYARKGGRGSSVLRSYVDAEMFLEGVGENYNRPGGSVKVSWTKPPRDGLCPEPIRLVRGDDGVLTVGGAPGGDTLTTHRRRLIREAVSDGFKPLDEIGTYLSANGAGIGDRTLQRDTKPMEAKGILIRDPAWKSGLPVRYGLPNPDTATGDRDI